MDVWVVESGDYEQRSIQLIAASLEHAEAAVKYRFQAPYIVAWAPIKILGDGNAYLAGDFEAVLHYSTRHRGEYYITRYPVVGAQGAPETTKT